MADVTTLIRAANQGSEQAVNRLFEALYDDLHRLAKSRMRRSDPLTLLDTTSLVHESYMRFVRAGDLRINDREHFLAYAAKVMRNIVVDLVRERGAERRGGNQVHLTLNTDIAESIASRDCEVLGVHEALQELAAVDERLVKVVELRYFAGLTEEETASVLGVTDRTVRRDWEKARLLLAAILR
jgi:RNA polymerase sigma factor (TIGR02999 family)